MSDLLVTTHTPVLGSGQAVRTYGVARALAAHGPLTLLYVRFGATEPDGAFRAIPGVELRAVVPSRGPRRALAYASARRAGVPRDFARGVSRELAFAVAQAAAEPDRGRVIADGPIAAAALARLARTRPVLYNAHNVESGFRHELEGRVAGREAMRAFERGLLERASESWMVSEADMDAARELCPGARLRYAPNVVDVAAIAPVTPAACERRAIFVASFSYEPNREGLRFLLEQVFPRVWAELPDARLTLVGAGLERPPSADPRVETLGFVDDLAAAYARASCAVVPLLHGGGTPLKLIEALAYGLPVIATPRAAAALHVRDGEHCLLAGDGPAFASALVRVLRDGAPELGRRGRELVERDYSIDALSRLLDVR
ncbi:MAG TPA: glycosyltransferase [Solirubrobacteraceae bacterium]|nr:glycosyltransferase [Solirubrobacteraceae bacterium]